MTNGHIVEYTKLVWFSKQTRQLAVALMWASWFSIATADTVVNS
jgi:hypothetical protein